LISQLILLTSLTILLPASKSSEECGKIIIVYLGQSKALTLDEVLQKIISLNVKMVNCLIHPLDPTLGGANQVLVCDDLVNQLLL
jgi:hypothetical protein